MQSLSVNLRPARNLNPSIETNRSELEITTEDSTTLGKDDQKGSKIGSLKFKISFMRGKFFQDNQLSKVLLTQSEKGRRQKKL